MELFFPSHDIALSHGIKHFSAPKAAEALGNDLHDLAEVWNDSRYVRQSSSHPLPWGWDWDTRQLLNARYKAPMSNLPSDADLEMIRNFSSRKTTISLLRSLKSLLVDNQDVQGTDFPVWIESQEALQGFINDNGNESQDTPSYVLKTPWSSSGRGLILSTQPIASQMKQAEATIRKMGGIIGERWNRGKVHDFAMLFYGAKGCVKFIGYSLFENQTSGGGVTYGCGYLMSNEEIETRLGIPYLREVARAYETILTDLLNPLLQHEWPLGFMGIDMMTMNGEDGGLRLRPCVEFNLRCTMGVVCRCMYEKLGKSGMFRVSQMDSEGHFCWRVEDIL